MNERTQNQIHATSVTPFTPAPSGLLQRKCACGNHAMGGECEECGKKREGMLQGKAADSTEMNEVPPIVREVLRSPGQPLDAATRAFMEPRFGHDFSQVRVHTDARAAKSTRAVNALAYTAGRDIVFDARRYAPQTSEGKRLLAHELTHVVQQGATTLPAHLAAGPAGSQQEREADAMASVVMPGRGQLTHPLPVSYSPSALLQREAATDEGMVNIREEEVSVEPAEEEDFDVMDGDSPVSGSESEELLVEGPEEQGESEEFASLPTADVETTGEAATGEVGSITSEAIELKGGKGATKKGGGKKKGGTKPKTTKKITRIDIDLSSQKMVLTWEIKTETKTEEGKTETKTEEKPEKVTISSGKGCPNTAKDPCESGDNLYCTPTGNFKVGIKGDGETKNSSGDRMSWYVEFVPTRDIGIHDSQKADGTPRSHGCVRVGDTPAADALAEKINKNAPKGTPVIVDGKAPTKPFKRSKEKMGSYKGCPPPPEPKPKSKAGGGEKKK